MRRSSPPSTRGSRRLAVDVPLHEVLEPVVNKTDMSWPAPNARKLFAYIAARNASETVDANAVFRAEKS
ncbi:MAG: hypothetical protein U0235_30820 [Polyangiaceae bacterium]